MDTISLYVILLTVIFTVGVIFYRSTIPTSLLLVMVGMLLSFIPSFPHIEIDPHLILQLFIPLLVYEISAFSSWRDIKTNIRPILWLSVGHVFFITVLVACVAHALVPSLGWPMCFVLGAVVSPPDSVAIVSLAEKIYLPRKIITILTGEGLLNDAAALIVFRFALAAVITHEFILHQAILEFSTIVVVETLYGLVMGFVIGELRLRLRDANLQMVISLLTPFLVYLPAQKLGGSGILAIVVTGFVIGYRYLERLPPEIRILGTSIWKTLGFLVQSLLFLLVGLDLRFIIERIALIPVTQLILYAFAVIFVVIVGRFIWVFPAFYWPQLFFFSRRKKEPQPPWQYPFIISWSGMRGGISLAAALIVPLTPVAAGVASPRDLLVFLVFCVIVATLILQGLALPWVVKTFGILQCGQQEKHSEHLRELEVRLEIVNEVLHWLFDCRQKRKDDASVLAEINFHIKEFQTTKIKLRKALKNHPDVGEYDVHMELKDIVALELQIIEIERSVLAQLWRENKISHELRMKLMRELDFQTKHY